MIVSLIGMSNTGKTYWAKQLENKGFFRFSCDDYIQKKLEEELKRGGFDGIEDVAMWMGQPFDRQYKEASKQYMSLETDAMKEIFSRIKKEKKKNIVIDTTGSIIYIDSSVLHTLRTLTTVVYFSTPPSIRKEMYQMYIKNPKPVIWGKSFFTYTNESPYDALARCYPKFLAFRAKGYRKLAHITIDYFTLRNTSFSVDDLLSRIEV